MLGSIARQVLLGYRITLILLHLHAVVLHTMYGVIAYSQTDPLQGEL